MTVSKDKADNLKTESSHLVLKELCQWFTRKIKEQTTICFMTPEIQMKTDQT